MNSFDFFLATRAFLASLRDRQHLIDTGADIDAIEFADAKAKAYETILEENISQVEQLYGWPHDGTAHPNPRDTVIP